MLCLSDYDYELPPGRIAQRQVEPRDQSRLLKLERVGGGVSHHRFREILRFLSAGDVLVVNDTAVVPARLLGRKESGGKVEVFLIDYAGGQRPDGVERFTCECLIKSSKQARPGTRIFFDGGLTGTIVAVMGGTSRVEFSAHGDFDMTLNRVGHVPLPPYIFRADEPHDHASYQTVYAAVRGAVAAPTAGLHFSRYLLHELQGAGVRIVTITLHVGYGTFAPVRAEDIRDHRMHAERFSVPEKTAEAIRVARANGNRVVAVGTTVVRTLEFAADGNGRVAAVSGACDLFIYPGYRFKTGRCPDYQFPFAEIDPAHAGVGLCRPGEHSGRLPRSGSRRLPIL